MNCSKAQHLLSAYIDSELTGIEMITIREHLGKCDICKNEYKTLLATKKLYGMMLPKKPVNDNLAVIICNKIHLEHDIKHKDTFSISNINLSFLFARFKYAAISAGLISAFLILGASTLSNNDKTDTMAFNANLISYIINDQFGSENIKKENHLNMTNVKDYDLFNVLSNSNRKQERPMLFSNNTQMLLASYQ